jgi:DNA-binding NarL/FixJ family response regulator
MRHIPVTGMEGDLVMLEHSADDIMDERAIAAEPQDFSIDCVFLTCFNSEFQVFSILLGHSGVRMHCADTLEQADFLLAVTGAKVLLSDAVFLDGTWYEAAEMLADVHSSVTLVVVLDELEKTFWADCLNRGGYDLTPKPLRLNKLHQAIRNAHHSAMSGDSEALPFKYAPAQVRR